MIKKHAFETRGLAQSVVGMGVKNFSCLLVVIEGEN